MVYLFLVLAIGLFIISLKILGVVRRVGLVIRDVHDAMSVIRSTDISEEEKEAEIQKAAIGMLGSFFSITLRVAATLAIPVLFVAVGSLIELYTYEEAIYAASDWKFIITSTAVMIGAMIVVR